MNYLENPRRVELVTGRFIRDSGRTRATLGGDQAVVWVGVEFLNGRAA